MADDLTHAAKSRPPAVFSQMQTLEHAARISLADYREFDDQPQPAVPLARTLIVGTMLVVGFAGLLLLGVLF